MRNISRPAIEAIVRQLLQETGGNAQGVANAVVAAFGESASIPVGEPKKPELVVISARHIHLTDAGAETLFGKGKTLTDEGSASRRIFCSQRNSHVSRPA